jgi:hypothetical protein
MPVYDPSFVGSGSALYCMVVVLYLSHVNFVLFKNLFSVVDAPVGFTSQTTTFVIRIRCVFFTNDKNQIRIN